MREVLDPELGVNIVDLGLVRAVAIDNTGLHITLTMTSPACPLGETLMRDTKRVLQRHGVLEPVEVEIAHEPPWSPDCMTAAAKRQLGWPDDQRS